MKDLLLQYPYEFFTVLTVLAALFHWIQKASKGEASFNPVEYWLKDTPGYTAGTLVALLLAWWGVVSGELLEGVKWQVIVGLGVGTGYTLNSAISKGSGADAALTRMAGQGGFITMRMLAVLLGIAFTAAMAVSITGCVSAPQTQKQGQALSYYELGQAMDQIDGKWSRGEISTQTARAYKRQVDFSRSLLDLYRNPSSADVQTALRTLIAELAGMSINGKPVLTPGQLATANRALDIAAQVTAGGTLPATDDSAGWMLLGADVLRAVNAATQ